MNLSMNPIPTDYKGIRFRSRLEASWAAYFDALDLTWAYEPEGYLLRDGTKYLPDFYLSPTNRYEEEIFVECKPPSKNSVNKAGRFVYFTHKTVLLAMPEGRFFLCTYKYADILIYNDWDAIQHYTKTVSSLAMVQADAVDGPYNYFWNGGEECDLYVGQPPDYSDSIKDRNRPDGKDSRTYYYGGFSTWGQRGFQPPQWTAGLETTNLSPNTYRRKIKSTWSRYL